MSSLTIRIPDELWHIIRPVMDATGLSPGKVLLRMAEEHMGPPAQTSARQEAYALEMPVISSQGLAVIDSVSTLMRRTRSAVFGEAVNDAVVNMGNYYSRVMRQALEKKRRSPHKSAADRRAEQEPRGAYENGVWVPRASEEVERQFLREQAERAARDRPKMGTLTADERLWAEADAAGGGRP